MQSLNASAAVIFGTAGDRLISDAGFVKVWDEFARRKLPLCVHMGMSFPAFEPLCRSFQDANLIGKVIPRSSRLLLSLATACWTAIPN
jgi:hypothetical protein